MRITRYSLMGALTLATALSTSALAQVPGSPQPPSPGTPPPPATEPRAQEPDMASTIVGQLQSVNATTKTIVVKTAAGKEETLRYDDATKVTGGQSGVAGLANSKGTDVTVKFRGTGEDRVASEITIKEKKS